MEASFNQSRLAYYDFLAAVMMERPSIRTLEAICNRERVNTETYPNDYLKEGWQIIDSFLDEKEVNDLLLEEVTQEFTEIFLALGGGQVLPYESKYIDGKLMDRSLVHLRHFLKEIGLVRTKLLREPEDNLAVELDIMRHLIKKSLDDNKNGHWLECQELFLNDHLLCWGLDIFRDLEMAPSAKFYKGIAKIGYGFLLLEKESFGKLDLETKKTRGGEIYEKRKKRF
jgi:TorA maturation chaperone TorD